jgi:HSP20 family protein
MPTVTSGKLFCVPDVIACCASFRDACNSRPLSPKPQAAPVRQVEPARTVCDRNDPESRTAQVERSHPMAQNDQKSLAVRPSEQSQQSIQRNSQQAGISQRRESSPFGFGITPQEFFSSNPFSIMRRMTEEMDRVIHEFGLERDSGERAGWTPTIEVTERDGKYNVRAELPGLSPDDVRVEVANDALVIEGERKEEHVEKEKGVRRTERQYGLFYRSIPLPEGADAEHANAKFQNGILEVTIPIPQQNQNRRPIRIEGQTKSQQDTQKQAA